MNGLSAQFLDEIQKNLREELERIKERMNALKLQDPFQDPDHANDNAASDTEANEEAGHDRISSILDELSKQRDVTEQALRRIDDRSYGLCVSCGKEIGEGRLRVNPTAERCMTCESMA